MNRERWGLAGLWRTVNWKDQGLGQCEGPGGAGETYRREDVS